MFPLRRFAVQFATLVLLWTIVAQLNHALAPWRLYLWIGGLFITYGALNLPLRCGLLASFFAGLQCDAASGLTLGWHGFLFAAGHAALFHLRDRLPREEVVGRVVIALLLNLALFLLFSFAQIARTSDIGGSWPRLICDLLSSQIFLVLVAPWFFALQEAAQHLAVPTADDFDPRFD